MGKYKVIKKLGQGSYGTVYLVQDSKDGQHFVMKKITVSGMSDNELADCKKEIQILSLMKHPNITRYKRSFVRRGALCIVMEYADGGDLHAMIKDHRQRNEYFDEDQILDWFTQACLGLEHVHQQKILHRDLKTQNIFLTSSGEVRLGDFGISRVLKNTMDQANTLVGTPYYLSPEMVNGQPYNHTSDIWSMGVVLYEMLTLQHPFNADSLQMLALKIIQGNYPPIPAQYSDEVNDLLPRMLEQDAKKRLDIEGVLRTPIILERVRRFMPEHRLINGEAEEVKRDEDPQPEPEDDGVPQNLPVKKNRPRPPPKATKRISHDVNNAQVPQHSKNKLPPVPNQPKGQHARRRSREENLNVNDEEPDWEISGDGYAKNSKSPSAFQEPSVARGTQQQILRAYLEERIGADRLQDVIECLQSDLSDARKQAKVEQLTEGNGGLLPIVHTYMYLVEASKH